MHGKTHYPRRKMTRAKDNNNATILSIGISKGRIAYQKLIGSRHVKATVPTATSHWANSQTCCMQDERLCLPLIPSFDVPFEHKKALKHVLVRLLWHGFTEAHDHVSPFCLEYRHVAWCQVCDELKTCTILQGCVCGWLKGRRRLAHLALVKQHETTAKLAMFQEQR